MAFTDHAPTPIAQLNPELPTQTATVRGVVTIVWPYSSTTSSLSFTIAEPEYRLRRPKGQIRVNFAGHIAKEVSESGIGSGDELVICLDGVEWEAAATNGRLPSAGHEWQLKFSQKLRLQAKLNVSGETKVLEIDQPSTAPQAQPATPDTVEAPVIAPTPDAEYALPASFKVPPAKSRSLKRLADGEFASPAFIKRAQVSYGSLFEDGFDIFEDALGMFEEDGGARGRGRKRSKFGRQSGAWRYTSQSPERSPERSPEPEPEPEMDPEPEPEPEPQPGIEPEMRQEAVAAESKSGRPSLSPRPQRPQMTDEGCQTMEIDLPSPPAGFGSSTASLHLFQPVQGADSLADNVSGFLNQGHQSATSGNWGLAPISRGQPQTDMGLSLDEDRRSHLAHAIDFDLGMAGSQIQQHWSPQVPEVDPNLSSGPGTHPATHAEVFHPEYAAGPSSNLSAVRFGFGGPEAMPQYDVMQSDTHQHQHDMPYPPLDMQATTSTDSNHGVPSNPFSAQVPASYPEPEPASTSTNPFLSQDNVPAHLVQHMGSSSWAPINNTNVSADPAPEKRSASIDGQSPDNALVIDNSDDEAEAGEMAPEINATETSSFDTDHVLQPNHPEWNNIEGDEYEVEVDAQYSDDDEPEYDDNEKGGDYDTRNYVGPNDDEDDSHDEDLRPHHLEPEFDDGDGEEWDVDEDGQFEEDEEELYYEEEEEEGDAMDLDTPLQQRQPPPGTKSAPVVIDLLSSDDEDDDAPVPQPLPRTVQPATRQALPVTQLAPSSPQYSSEDVADDVEDEEDIFSDDAEDISEDDAEDEEVQLESSGSHEQDAHMEDAQDEKVLEAEEQSPLVKPKDLVEAQEEPMALPSLEETKATGQSGEGTETPKAVAFPVEDKVPMPDAEREIGDAQTNQPQIEPKEAGFHDSTIGESSVEDTNNIATGGPQMEEDDERSSVHLRVDEEPSQKDVDDQVAIAEGVNDHSDATSPKFDDDVASGASDTVFPPPPTEVNLLNQLDDKLEAAAQQNLAAVQSRASQRQLPTPLDSQLVEQPRLQESDGSQDSDSDDVMVMEIEEVVTTEVTTEERTQEPTIEAGNAIQASASTDLSEPVFQTQVPYRELFHTGVPNEPSQSQFESDTQMQDSVSDFVSQETFDDDTLQAALREGNSDDSEEEEEEEGDSVEDILQAALREEEVDQEEEAEEDALQAALREEEEKEDEEDEEDSGDDSEEDALQAALREEEDEALGYSIMHTNETVEVATSPMGEDEETSHSITHVNETVEVVTSPLNEDSSTLPTPAQEEDSVRATNKEEKGPTNEKIQSYPPSWLDSAPRLEPFRPAQTPTVQRNRPQSKERATPSIEVGDDSFTDPSVRLARASIASRRASRKHDATPESTRPHTRSMCFQMSPDYKGDASVQLAKASFNVPSNSSSRDQSKAFSTSPATSKFGEQLNPMPVCKAKIRRHLHDSIPDYTELKVLRHHIGKSVDVLAVALMSPPEPERAKKGPREYMMSFTVTDHSTAPSSIAEVQLYRPHKDTLPKVKSGDVVLLRNFTVLAIKNKDYGLRTNDSSSWAIFDTEDEPAQIRGPPVEYGESEMTHVDYLREWYGLLDAGSRTKLEAANKKFIEAGRNLSKQ
ncbi:hypothetical protein PG984_004365 [Apiospora sp. TS-2023a]